MIIRISEDEKSMCGNCGYRSNLKCGRCLYTMYCSKKCQIIHWKYHKNICTEINKNNLKEIEHCNCDKCKIYSSKENSGKLLPKINIKK